jgi:hypothetical protein
MKIEYLLEPNLAGEDFIGVLRRSSLAARTHLAAGLHTHLILVAAPQAETYYAHIGMVRHDSCWVIARQAG